jgi:ankyrin repeat protein
MDAFKRLFDADKKQEQRIKRKLNRLKIRLPKDIIDMILFYVLFDMDCLEEAIAEGDQRVVQFILERGPNIRAYHEENLMYAAIENDHTELAKWMYENGICRGQCGGYCDSTCGEVGCENACNGECNGRCAGGPHTGPVPDVIEIAISYDNSELIKYFIENGAVEELDECDADPILTAVENNNLSVVAMLHDMGEDLRKDDDIAAVISAKHGSISMMEYLCDAGVDITAYENEPMRFAARFKNYGLVKWLHEHGATLDVLNSDQLKEYESYMRR